MPSEWIRQLVSIRPQEMHLAGGKGRALAMMQQAGLPVPSGFVILAAAFELFLRDTGLADDIGTLRDLDVLDAEGITDRSRSIRQRLACCPVASELARDIEGQCEKLAISNAAVRSSANYEDGDGLSWAGCFDSYLNTPSKVVVENTRKCWASTYSARAIAYALSNGVSIDQLSMAVVVQQMVDHTAHGVCFTADPISGNRDYLVVESSYVPGDSVVGGRGMPGVFRIDRHHLSAETMSGALAQEVCVPEATGTDVWQDAHMVARTCLDAEHLFGRPLDVEWVLTSKGILLLQARPLTGAAG